MPQPLTRDAQPLPARIGRVRLGPGIVLAEVVLHVLPFAVPWWAGPLAWVGLTPGAVGLRWTTRPPYRRRLALLYLALATVSLGTLLLGLSGTDTTNLR